MKQIFASERIRYFQITEELMQDYFRMVNGLEHVGRFIGREEPITESDERRWIQN